MHEMIRSWKSVEKSYVSRIIGFAVCRQLDYLHREIVVENCAAMLGLKVTTCDLCQ